MAAISGIDLADLGTSRAGGAAKFVAVDFACRLTGMTQRAIGAHYGEISSVAVSNIRRRLRGGQYAFADMVAQLYQRIIPVSSSSLTPYSPSSNPPGEAVSNKGQ